MKNVLVALLLTTGAVACAENRPAEEPTTTTSASATTAVTPQKPTPTTLSAPAANQAPLSTSTDNTAVGTAATPGTTSSMKPSDGSNNGAPILGDTRSTATNDSSGTATAGTTTKTGRLTPMDQGGSKGDRDITAAIRRSVVGDSSLSFAGKNVKIITNDGHVTLRGQVKSDAEKSTIDGKARNAAGVTDVDNQLTVKP